MVQVWIVPNPEDPNKPEALPFRTRIRLLRGRIDADAELAQLVEIHLPPLSKLDWAGRRIVCDELSSNLPEGSQLYQLIGTDSLMRSLQPLGKDAVERIRQTLLLDGRKLLVFPRLQYDSGMIPQSNDIIVVDYQDEIAMSSTSIREKLHRNEVSRLTKLVT